MSRIQASRQSQSGTAAIGNRHGAAATVDVAERLPRAATAGAVMPQAKPVAAETRDNALAGLLKQTDKSISNAEKQSPPGARTPGGLFCLNRLYNFFAPDACRSHSISGLHSSRLRVSLSRKQLNHRHHPFSCPFSCRQANCPAKTWLDQFFPRLHPVHRPSPTLFSRPAPG